MSADNKDDRERMRLANRSYDRGEYEKALAAFLHLAERGDVDGQRVVGWMYNSGTGTAKDLEKAKYWLKLAADRDDAPSQYLLGVIHWRARQDDRAFEFFEKSAGQGYGPGLYRLAICYSLGRGASKNEDKTLALLEEASRKENLRARIEYAKRLMKGRKGLINIFRGMYLFVLWWIEGGIVIFKNLNALNVKSIDEFDRRVDDDRLGY
ncbi:MAG: tetratricopeptide repeat protein [Alphaproteobacteria bacterium]|nr:tetratricopeptide repeat protein [Alphaproteobacteria bacterium]